jgi:hypothetical protein
MIAQKGAQDRNGNCLVGGRGEGWDNQDEKPEEGGGKPRVLEDGMYATESAYTSTTTTRLEAVKAAVRPPLRSMFPPCFGLILWLLTFVSLHQRLF